MKKEKKITQMRKIKLVNMKFKNGSEEEGLRTNWKCRECKEKERRENHKGGRNVEKKFTLGF